MYLLVATSRYLWMYLYTGTTIRGKWDVHVRVDEYYSCSRWMGRWSAGGGGGGGGARTTTSALSPEAKEKVTALEKELAELKAKVGICLSQELLKDCVC